MKKKSALGCTPGAFFLPLLLIRSVVHNEKKAVYSFFSLESQVWKHHVLTVTSAKVINMDRFHNAVNALEAARSSLFLHEDARAAAALQGLEVYSAESAEVALDVVRSLNVRAFESKCALLDAANALEIAVYGREQTVTVPAA